MTLPQPADSALIAEIRQLIDSARQRAAAAVNAELSLLYWQVGRRLAIEVLGGERASYGERVVAQLAEQLTAEYGRGWGERQLRNCLRFAETFPDETIVHTVCAKLSWSHLRLLAAVDDPFKRDFYTELCRLERWSVRQLQDRMRSLLFERSAISKQPDETIRHDLAALRKEQRPSPAVLLKDPYILGLQDRYLERDLEDAILREIEHFLLELGAGFTFVARQKRLQIDNDDFYIDLLLYNRKLPRLVAVELKVGEFRAEFKGQMELYLRWLAKYEREEGEDLPFGIILCAGASSRQIELLELDAAGIHVSEYLTVLPPRAVLE
jgi:predicted nuclease of restriction endonuclease-like (RecB) superfamily